MIKRYNLSEYTIFININHIDSPISRPMVFLLEYTFLNGRILTFLVYYSIKLTDLWIQFNPDLLKNVLSYTVPLQI